MPPTRGEAIGYDADLMAFKFTMRNGEQIVQCQISNAALSNLAGRWRGAARDVPAEFEAHRELIEAIGREPLSISSRAAAAQAKQVMTGAVDFNSSGSLQKKQE